MATLTDPGQTVTPVRQELRLRRLGWVVLGITLALNVASMAVPALIDHPLTRNRGEIQLYLDVFVEGNLPTWWSTGLLVVAAVAFAVVGGLARAARAGEAWAWFVCAGVLGLLSLDDHTQLHERLDRIGRRLVSFDGFPFYWLLPGLVAGAAVATAFLLLAFRLPRAGTWCVAGGCALLLAGALGGELAQGLLIAEGESGPLYVLTYHAEELAENLGVLVLLAAAVRSVAVLRQDGGALLRYRVSPTHERVSQD
ncbi:hypothetical protein [Amycolatopsis cihanbeyliensis]|uniref:Uncharacterized protein n=1 Tax=Amycolatopsis cihanbeyliensis TaxID=1128664 RepID=A0A542DMC5_AMYCI|nr:hypothetical protein [Amycolatopsis cihanbeyliensis]TQJ04253.1 hypothetical protein FB471_4036 [Amycolatopsis cihanbeyliensis]